MKKSLFLCLGVGAASMLSADVYFNQAPATKQNFGTEHGVMVPQPTPPSNLPKSPEGNNPTSDEEIQRNISEAITYWAEQGINNISFEVEKGEVLIRGKVNTPDERTKIEESIKKIPGVKNVKNEINSAQQPKTSQLMTGKSKHIGMADSTATVTKKENDIAKTDADKQLNKNIRDSLRKLKINKIETIVLKSENGVITITGILETPEDVKKVTDQIKTVPGVKNVNSNVHTSKK